MCVWHILFLFLYVCDWTIVHTPAENCGVERFCGNGAVCVNESCTCREGFGDRQKGVGKVDYCYDICYGKNKSCPAGATCIQYKGNWRCTCALNYQRSDLGVCEDFNECNIALCGNNTDCVNTPGSYRCDCKPGYARDGTNQRTLCHDINECQVNSSNCGSRANCTNVPGSYLCQCPEGFYSDGDDKPRCLPQTTSVPTPMGYSSNTDAYRYTTTEIDTRGSNSLYIGLGVGISCLVLALALVVAITYRKRRHNTKKAEVESADLRNESGRKRAEEIIDGNIYESIVDPIDYYTNPLEFENEVCKSNISKLSNDSSPNTRTQISGGLEVTVDNNLDIGQVSATIEPTDNAEYNNIDDNQVVQAGETIEDLGSPGEARDVLKYNTHKYTNNAQSTDNSRDQIASKVNVLISDGISDQRDQVYNKGPENPPLSEPTDDDPYNKLYDSPVAPTRAIINDPSTDNSGFEIASTVKVPISDGTSDQHGQLYNKGPENPPLAEPTDDDPYNKLYDSPVFPIREIIDDLRTQGKAGDDPDYNTHKYTKLVQLNDHSGYEIDSKIKVLISDVTSDQHGQLNNKGRKNLSLAEPTDGDPYNKLYDSPVFPIREIIDDLRTQGKAGDDPDYNTHKYTKLVPLNDHSGYEIDSKIKVMISDVTSDQHGQLNNKGPKNPSLTEPTDGDPYNKLYDSQEAIEDLGNQRKASDDYSTPKDTSHAPSTKNSGYEIPRKVKVAISDQYEQLYKKGSEKPPLPETSDDDPHNKVFNFGEHRTNSCSESTKV